MRQNRLLEHAFMLYVRLYVTATSPQARAEAERQMEKAADKLRELKYPEATLHNLFDAAHIAAYPTDNPRSLYWQHKPKTKGKNNG